MKTLRLAVLIDADNVRACNIHVLMDSASKLGCVKTCRAYGNWNNPSLRPWKDQIELRDDMERIQQDKYTNGKNATDMTLAVDAMELLYTCEYDGFCVVSSDSDFTPLALKLKQNGRKVFGFGEKKTSPYLVDACDRFIYFEDLQDAASRKQIAEPRAEVTPLVSLLRRVVNEYADTNGWAPLSAIGERVPRDTLRQHGFARISSFLRQLPFFELRPGTQPTGTGGAMYVRWAGS
jgi:hypothetical protein